MALQLRFGSSGREILKSTVPVTLPKSVHLPFWVAGSVRRRRFFLSAAVVHLGASPYSGHLTTVLVDPDNALWLTDDNVTARRVTGPDASVILHNAYVVFLRPATE